jgi:hypothetical protein
VFAQYESYTHVSFFSAFIPTVDVKAIKAKATAYWFDNHKSTEQKQTAFKEVWRKSFIQICHVKKYFEVLLDYDIKRMPGTFLVRWIKSMSIAPPTFSMSLASCVEG